MFITLWNYIRGYVIIEVEGVNVERFINLCTNKNIYIWDIEMCSTKVKMCISIRGFKSTREFIRKTKTKVTIVERCGLPFVLFKYRRRKILFVGFVAFVCMMYFLSGFVWYIDISGNDRITNSDIIEFVNSNGVTVGVRNNMDKELLEAKMLEHFDDLSWVSITSQGTKLNIEIKETLTKKAIVDRNTPCDVVAVNKGIVVDIAVSSGKAMVREGDVVKEGDILVAGNILVFENENGKHYEQVHSQASIKAKRYYNLEFDVPYKYQYNEYTGNSKKKYSIIVKDTELQIKTKPKYNEYEKTTSYKQLNLGENYPLPIIIKIETYSEVSVVDEIRSEEQAINQAEIIVNNKIISEFDFGADIIDKDVVITKNENGINVKSTITTIEEIGEQKQLTVQNQPPTEETNTQD